MVENGLESEMIEMCIELFFFSLWVIDGFVFSFFLFFSFFVLPLSFCFSLGFGSSPFFRVFFSQVDDQNITQTNHHLYYTQSSFSHYIYTTYIVERTLERTKKWNPGCCM